MKEISSLQNPIIKEISSLKEKKYRDKTGLYLIEGYKGFVEAQKYGVRIREVFINKDSGYKVEGIDNIYAVNESILKKISTTESPPEIVATAFQERFSLDDILNKKNPLIIMLENIKDAGNLGAIIRTAVACGCSGIILAGTPVDIYNPKTVRSSAGNLWKIPIVNISDYNRIKELSGSIQIVGTVVSENKKSKIYTDIDYKKPTIIIFGSEAEGISDNVLDIANMSAVIPMEKEAESLNLSISVGVILYEAYHQRGFTV